MRYLTVEEILDAHVEIIAASGGTGGVRDFGGLNSAVAQPRMSFGEQDLYPDLAEKAAAIGYSLVCNHPFLDGNKRIGFASLKMMVILNGGAFRPNVDDAERTILALASGSLSRDDFSAWVRRNLK